MKNIDIHTKKLMIALKVFIPSFFISFILIFSLFFAILAGRFTDYLNKDVQIEALDGASFLSQTLLVNSSAEGSVYTTTTADPQIIFYLADKRFKFINIHISNLSESSQIGQLFWGFTDDNLSEEQSTTVYLNNGDNIFPLPLNNTDITVLRIDLSTSPGITMNIDSVKFLNFLPIPKRVWICALCAAFLIATIIMKAKAFKMRHVFRWGELIKENQFIIIYSIFLFLVYSAWGLITPYNGAPDEAMRMDVVRYLSIHWDLPRGDNPAIRNALWGFSYAYSPYITQIIGAFFIKIASFFTLSQQLLLYIARIPSILFSLGTAIFVYKIGRQLFYEQAFAVLLTVLVSLWPENTMIASYVNNDSFALFSISIMMYAWVIGIKSNWNMKSCLTLSIGAGLSLISYYNAFIFTMLSLFLWLCCAFSNKEDRLKTKALLGRAAIMLTIAFLICAWFYIRNAIIYKGDIFGMESSLEAGELYAIEYLKPSARNTFRQQGLSIIHMLANTDWVITSLNSFIACFGYMNIHPDKLVYAFYYLLITIGGSANIIGAINSLRKKRVNIFYAFATVSIPLAILLSAYNSWANDFQPQGRYFLTALIAVCILIVNGIKLLLIWINILEKHEKYIISVLIIGIVIAQVTSFYSVFEYFYPVTTLIF